MNLIGIKYGDREYKNLSTLEYITIHQYLNEWNMATLAGELRHNETPSQSMRDFIADVLTGEIRRTIGKKDLNISRNFEIYHEIEELALCES